MCHMKQRQHIRTHDLLGYKNRAFNNAHRTPNPTTPAPTPTPTNHLQTHSMHHQTSSPTPPPLPPPRARLLLSARPDHPARPTPCAPIAHVRLANFPYACTCRQQPVRNTRAYDMCYMRRRMHVSHEKEDTCS
jgi:hypothetical protein